VFLAIDPEGGGREREKERGGKKRSLSIMADEGRRIYLPTVHMYK